LILTVYGCDEDEAEKPDLDSYASEYVQLVLSIGNFNEYYIDAYLGPDSVLTAAKNSGLTLDQISGRLDTLSNNLREFESEKNDSIYINDLRKKRLLAHIESARAYTEKLNGGELTFEEEVERVYGYSYEIMDLDEINLILDSISSLLPGQGSIADRWRPLRKRFLVPTDKIDTLFMKSISDAREATLNKIALPQSEMFKVEYVKDQPWSAYNWYKGDYYSLIQVNTDADIFIDRPIDLAAHEGYPGHHTYQCLMEKTFLKDRYWPEYTVYPLFSPTALLSEGLAEYGIDIVFGDEEKYEYEKIVLMPLAGMDTTGFDLFKKVSSLVSKLDHAGLYAASGYINGNLSKEETKDFLIEYALMSEEKASQRVDFIDRFGAYIINYTLGVELVSNYIKQAGPGSEDLKWAAYIDILSNPYIPSDLIIK
jgi:hypothetical protein